MTDPAQWQTGNEEYLALALTWLRLRLAWHVASERPPILLPPSSLETEASPAVEQSRWRFLRRHTPAPLQPLAMSMTRGLLPPAPADTVTAERVAQAATAMAEAEEMDPPPALIIAAQRFGLSRFERDVLLLCAAMELDTGIASQCARVNGDANRAHPTFALAFSLFGEPAWDALSPERPLRYWRLIEINQPGAQPLTTSAIRADERIVNYIKGLNYLDDRFSPLLFPFSDVEDQTTLPPSQQTIVETVVSGLKQAIPATGFPNIHLLGPDSSSKQLVAAGVAASLALHLYRMPAQLLPTQAADLETLARLWQRESLLLPVALYLDAHESEVAGQTEDKAAPPVNRFLARTGGVVFLSTRDAWPRLNERVITLDVEKPTPAEQRAAWAAALGQSETDADPASLTSQFNLNLTTIKQIARSALDAGDAGDREDGSHRLWDACLANARPHLDNLAQRLTPKATLDEIVLPEAEKRLLQQIAEQVGQRTRVYEEWGFALKMNRGLGISALFAGDSGTGKTMAAEGIAKKLRLDLYRIDLSAVVSKYIGETEKNLRRLFDAAEDGGAILFFDEADALFGKRSEVKDSHDRYANIEVNYLLQRIEAYRGLAILATNMKDALDQAFMRRLRFVVDFPYPGQAERKAIWQGIFPDQTATADLDFDRLARLDLTGGNIQNVALNAAFLAAHSESRVTMRLIFEAARAEFRKLGRFISEADFRWTEPIKTDPPSVTPTGFGGIEGGAEGVIGGVGGGVEGAFAGVEGGAEGIRSDAEDASLGAVA
jgi:ATP-dependent 26S proteasome regulatory subunit